MYEKVWNTFYNTFTNITYLKPAVVSVTISIHIHIYTFNTYIVVTRVNSTIPDGRHGVPSQYLQAYIKIYPHEWAASR